MGGKSTGKPDEGRINVIEGRGAGREGETEMREKINERGRKGRQEQGQAEDGTKEDEGKGRTEGSRHEGQDGNV